MIYNIGTSGCRSGQYGAAAVCGLVILLGLSGCGGGTSLAPVKGKVTYQGKPVTGGMVVFTPVEAGRPAYGSIQSDGTYTLTTNREGDGAAVGPNRVQYMPPVKEATEEQIKDPKYNPPPPPYMGLGPKTEQVEVKSGDNSFDIELGPKKRF